MTNEKKSHGLYQPVNEENIMEIKDEEFYSFIVQLLDDTEGISSEAMMWLVYFTQKTEFKDIKSIMSQTVKVNDRYFLRAGWIR